MQGPSCSRAQSVTSLVYRVHVLLLPTLPKHAAHYATHYATHYSTQWRALRDEPAEQEVDRQPTDQGSGHFEGVRRLPAEEGVHERAREAVAHLANQKRSAVSTVREL